MLRLPRTTTGAAFAPSDLRAVWRWPELDDDFVPLRNEHHTQVHDLVNELCHEDPASLLTAHVRLRRKRAEFELKQSLYLLRRRTGHPPLRLEPAERLRQTGKSRLAEIGDVEESLPLLTLQAEQAATRSLERRVDG